HADVLFPAEGERPVALDLALDEAVGRLEAVHGGYRRGASQPFQVVVADADRADLPLLPQVLHRPHGFINRRRPVRPVDLVQIDDVDAQALEALLALVKDAVAPRVAADRHRDAVNVGRAPGVGPVRAVPPAATLGGDHDLVPRDAADGLADDLLAATLPVNRGGVDRVDAVVDRCPDRVDR